MHIGEFYGPARVTGSVVAASATSVTLLPANDSRRNGSFLNHGSGSLYIAFGEVATFANFNVKLTSGSFYEMTHPIHTGTISGVWDEADGFCMGTEWSAPELKY